MGFEVAIQHFRGCATVTGTPVRAAFRKQSSTNEPLLLVTGGSQGARAINRLVTEARLVDLPILHLCGERDLDEVKTACAKHSARAEIHAFYEDMPSALARASLVISRAGASSLAELAAARVPAILIPLPNAVDDHQRANARAAEQSGGVIVLEQDEIKPDDLAKLVRGLMDDPVRLNNMAKAIRVLDAPDSARHIAGRILERLG